MHACLLSISCAPVLCHVMSIPAIPNWTTPSLSTVGTWVAGGVRQPYPPLFPPKIAPGLPCSAASPQPLRPPIICGSGTDVHTSVATFARTAIVSMGRVREVCSLAVPARGMRNHSAPATKPSLMCDSHPEMHASTAQPVEGKEGPFSTAATASLWANEMLIFANTRPTLVRLNICLFWAVRGKESMQLPANLVTLQAKGGGGAQPQGWPDLCVFAQESTAGAAGVLARALQGL